MQSHHCPTAFKGAKCKMRICNEDVIFMIDTGASVNTLPARYAKDIEPYNGTLTMWNKTQDKPAGKCRMIVTNPKNNRKYSVPFIVFNDDRVPILSYRTSLKMRLITVETDNFDMIAAFSTDCFSDVFNGALGCLPGTQSLELKPGSRPVIMGQRRVLLALRPQ